MECALLKVVVDTNLIVSATISPKASPHRLLMAWRHGQLTLVTSMAIVAEVVRVLGYRRISERYGLTYERIASVEQALVSDALVVEPTERLSVIEADPDDNRILECAVAGRADYILRRGRSR